LQIRMRSPSSSGWVASRLASGLEALLGQLWRLHPLHRIGPQVALSDGPLEEGVEASIAVVGGGRLPTGQLVGDERLDVLAAELAGEERSAVGLAVGGEEPDGVGVGLDGPGALVLGLQGAPEAAVRIRRWPRGSCRSPGTGGVDDIVPLIRVWWSGWLAAACSG
jgi:hypothetical protein